jgi:hypothetical protein
MGQRKPKFFDLGSDKLPKRILEIRKKLKLCMMIGRVDLSCSLVSYGRTETRWMRELREGMRSSAAKCSIVE